MLYIASPYSNTTEEHMEQRALIATSYVKEMFLRSPGVVRYSPIMNWHYAALKLGMPRDAGPYIEYNRAALRICSGMEVLTMPGWKESRGVRMELEWADLFNIPVTYVDPHNVIPCAAE